MAAADHTTCFCSCLAPRSRCSERAAAGDAAPSSCLPVRSVGNSQALRETALVEALNLRAAIEMAVGNDEGAREALEDMPPRCNDGSIGTLNARVKHCVRHLAGSCGGHTASVP